MTACRQSIATDSLARRLTKSKLWGVRDVDDIIVLICGHGGRDRRCGLLGPVLQEEFESKLPGAGIEVLTGPVQTDIPSLHALTGEASGRIYTSRVGLISHVGGHKFAGNVIIYLPPKLRTKEDLPHPLAGHGIWYGRVEPRHVEGLISETILTGRVIEDLFRGAIRQNGEILRL